MIFWGEKANSVIHSSYYSLKRIEKKGENEADGKNVLDIEWAEVTEGLKIGRGGG